MLHMYNLQCTMYIVHMIIYSKEFIISSHLNVNKGNNNYYQVLHLLVLLKNQDKHKCYINLNNIYSFTQLNKII